MKNKLNNPITESLVSDQSKIYFVALLAYLLAIFYAWKKSNGKHSIIKHVTCVLEITAVKPFLRKPKDATKKIKKKKSFKQLIMGTKQPVQLPAVVEKLEVDEATTDDIVELEKLDGDQSSSPDLNQNRKKRMKKRRQQRKNFDEDSSSLSSNGQVPEQQQAVQAAPTTVIQNQDSGLSSVTETESKIEN